MVGSLPRPVCASCGQWPGWPVALVQWRERIRGGLTAGPPAWLPAGFTAYATMRYINRRSLPFLPFARLPKDMPAHQALRCHVDLTLGHLPDQSWKRRPGRPNNRWIDQLRRDSNNTPPADLWRRSTTRGHSGVTLRSSMTTRWRRRRRITTNKGHWLMSTKYTNNW